MQGGAARAGTAQKKKRVTGEDDDEDYEPPQRLGRNTRAGEAGDGAFNPLLCAAFLSCDAVAVLFLEL
jgi:hypothetical protein